MGDRAPAQGITTEVGSNLLRRGTEYGKTSVILLAQPWLGVRCDIVVRLFVAPQVRLTAFGRQGIMKSQTSLSRTPKILIPILLVFRP